MRANDARGRRSRAALIALLLVISAVGAGPAGAATSFEDPSFSTETVVALSQYMPVGIAFGPGGRLFVWQRNGLVRLVQNGVLRSTPFVDIHPQVNQFGDRGLLGLAVDPDFQNNGFVYLLYTHEPGGNPIDPGPKTARLTRVQADPAAGQNVALPGSEIEILGGLPSDGSSHSIGSVHFAPDGTLFVSVGDGASYAGADVLALHAQDLTSASGKILRINPDGSAPPSNPFYVGPAAMRSRVWAYGLRNPFRFAVHPVSGEPYIGDVGWNTWEEINRGMAGRNFGWPCWEGPDPQPLYGNDFPSQCQAVTGAAPLYSYDHSVGRAAVSGAFYTGDVYPDAYRGSLFIADYTTGWIRRLVLGPSDELQAVHDFAAGVAGPVSLVQGPDGLLYYVELNTGRVVRVRYNGPAARASATPASGGSPLTVAFSSAGSSVPGGGAPHFLWDLGDGTTSTDPDPTHTYTVSDPRTFTATLTVSAPGGASAAATVSITVGSAPPVATITTPAAGTVHVGDTVQFQGSATDLEEGTLGPGALEWTVLLHHDTHVHPVLTTSGASGSFAVVDHGSGTFAYEIILTATDASGLTASRSVLLPVVVASVARVTAVTVSPNSVVAGSGASGSVSLSQPAATGGAVVALLSSTPSLGVPSTVTVLAGATSATFAVTTSAGSASITATVTATLGGSAQVSVTLNPGPPPASPPPTKGRKGSTPSTPPAASGLAVTSVAPAGGAQGATLSVTIKGRNFASGVRCSFGAGIAVGACRFVSATRLIATIQIATSATTGKRTVTVTGADGRTASLTSGFAVSRSFAGPPVSPRLTR